MLILEVNDFIFKLLFKFISAESDFVNKRSLSKTGLIFLLEWKLNPSFFTFTLRIRSLYLPLKIIYPSFRTIILLAKGANSSLFVTTIRVFFLKNL